jgi:hypothetical protein
MKLIDAIAIVESDNYSTAIRFEPTLYENPPSWIVSMVGKICAINKCSYDTGIMIACTSFGTWQLLGANLYAQGYAKPILALQVSDEELTARKFLLSIGFNPDLDVTEFSPNQLLQFATKYNGPADPVKYAKAIVRAAA